MQVFWSGFGAGVIAVILPSLIAVALAIAFARPDADAGRVQG